MQNNLAFDDLKMLSQEMEQCISNELEYNYNFILANLELIYERSNSVFLQLQPV